jgi:hypothetical protein
MRLFRLLGLLVILTFALTNVNAQDADIDDFSFDTEEIQTEKPVYFAIGGGYAANFMFYDPAPINNVFAKGNAVSGFEFPEFEKPIVMHGATAILSTYYIPNTRIGFFLLGGNQTKSYSLTENEKTYDMDMKYSQSILGGSIDYGFILMKSLVVLPGLGFGHGNMTFEATKTNSAYSWSDFDNMNDENFIKRAETGYWFVQPQLNIEYAVTGVLAFRLNANYILPFGQKDWKYNNSKELTNTLSDIETKGFSVQLGLMVGLFNY